MAYTEEGEREGDGGRKESQGRMAYIAERWESGLS